jgi:site-specific recombinase XerC
LPDDTEVEQPWVVGLRDRALIGVMTYSFARISAVVGMKVEDYYPAGKRWWVRLHEKGGKQHEMPAHHKLEQFLDEYLAAAGIREDGNTPLFRSTIGRTGRLTENAMDRVDAYSMKSSGSRFKMSIGCSANRPRFRRMGGVDANQG